MVWLGFLSVFQVPHKPKTKTVFQSKYNDLQPHQKALIPLLFARVSFELQWLTIMEWQRQKACQTSSHNHCHQLHHHHGHHHHSNSIQLLFDVIHVVLAGEEVAAALGACLPACLCTWNVGIRTNRAKTIYHHLNGFTSIFHFFFSPFAIDCIFQLLFFVVFPFFFFFGFLPPKLPIRVLFRVVHNFYLRVFQLFQMLFWAITAAPKVCNHFLDINCCWLTLMGMVVVVQLPQ